MGYDRYNTTDNGMSGWIHFDSQAEMSNLESKIGVCPPPKKHLFILFGAFFLSCCFFGTFFFLMKASFSILNLLAKMSLAIQESQSNCHDVTGLCSQTGLTTY